MNILRLTTSLISILLVAAHYSRAGDSGMFFLAAGLIVLLFEKKKWAGLLLGVIFLFTLPVWIHTALRIILIRQAAAVPWHLAAFIMALVTLAALGAALLNLLSFYRAYRAGQPLGIPSLASFLLTALILFTARSQASFLILLPDRFLYGSGMLLIIIMAWYASWLTGRFIDSKDTAKMRFTIWLFFSLVFFIQAITGLTAHESFLMTGTLHVPVPAVIIGGPLYRGGGLFMVILFSSTLLLTGSAWCSHFCYFGAWDNLGAKKTSSSTPLTPLMKKGRYLTLGVTIAAALALRAAGLPEGFAAILALLFGTGGIAIMALVSRRRGLMVHCTAWCPLGLLANLGGKLSPFRIKIHDTCTSCMACASRCRYGALEKRNIAEKKPGITCSLCGDCLAACPGEAITYTFPRLSREKSRILFLILVSSLHAAFLSLARI